MYKKTEITFESTVENTLTWRIWHGFNYLLGGITFLLGSMIYYPYFNNFLTNTFQIAGWLYTIGSVGFLLADLTQWNHYRTGCLPCEGNNQLNCTQKFSNKQLGINFFCSAIGSGLYLWGSIYFIPSLNKLQEGETLFIVGSTFIYLSQGWKLWRTCFSGDKSVSQNIGQDLSGFLVDLFAGIGGVFYFFGTFIFHKSQKQTSYFILAVHFFVAGGASFFISGLFIAKRYFLQSKKTQELGGEQLQNLGDY